jgi:hypothetical protein
MARRPSHCRLALVAAAIGAVAGAAILPLPARSDVLTVAPDGSGDYPTIQAAIDAANDRDIIELLDGTFTGDGNRDLDPLQKQITVRSRGDDAEQCRIDCGGEPGSPHVGFRLEGQATPAFVLEGITIENGYTEDRGGAIQIVSSGYAMRAERCAFRNNVALEWGGAIYLPHDSVAEFRDCTFAGNMAPEKHPGGYGGAVHAYSTGHIEFTRCTFSNNEAAEQGGAINLLLMLANFEDCVFVDNHAGGGGAVWSQNSTPSFVRCSFSGNTATEDAGAVAFSVGYGGWTSQLIHCTLWGNHAGRGGAVGIFTTDPLIDHCVIHDNSASEGAAIFLFGSGDAAIIRNTIITANLEGPAVTCDAGLTVLPELSCSDIVSNAGGDWVGCIADQAGVDGNLSAPPQFCSSSPGADGHYALQSDSPCAATAQPTCGSIGASAETCGTSIVETRSWGRIKRCYR